MRNEPLHGSWVIVASMAAALMLTMLPLPDWAEHARPEWVALVLIYWVMALPQRIGVGAAWVCGLFLDVVRGAVLGQHALALTLIAFITLKLHLRLRVYPLWQQATVVLMLVALEQMLVLWIKGFLGLSPEGWFYWVPALVSALLWPWLYLILRDLRRHFRVN